MQTEEKIKIGKVVDLCSNYYSIIEEPIAKDDIITKELSETYKCMVLNTDPSNEKELDRVILFDESLYLYFNNEKFKEKFLLEFNQLDSNITIENSLCDSYIKFKNDPKNKVSNTKWI